MSPAGAWRASMRRRTSLRISADLERAHLARDELRLARLLVVDASLHDEHPVGLEELARRRVRRVEDDDLGAPGRVVERHEDHRVAALRRHLLEAGDDAADGDELAVATALEVGERAVRLAPSSARTRSSGCSET